MTIEHDRQSRLAHLYRIADGLWRRPEVPVSGPEAELATGLSSLYYDIYHEFPTKPDRGDYDADVWLPPEPDTLTTHQETDTAETTNAPSR